MIKLFKTIVVGIASLCLLSTTPVLAQTASILPNARTQFIDANGNPIVGGTVGFYVPSTLTSKTTWQDPGKTTPNTNPITLDGLGSGLIWGSGTYREILKNSSGSVIWDGLTSQSGGDAIGTVNGILQANGSGAVSALTIGTGLSYTGGTLSSTTSGGTVTSVTAGSGLSGGTCTTACTLTVASDILRTGLYNQVNASASATCNCGFFGWVPTNYGSGKPGLFINKDATANSWTLGLFDGATDNGTLNLSASTVVVPGVVNITGGSTIAGSAICTQATGCTGGTGGGYATVYDVVHTYGGDPLNSGGNTTPLNLASAACSTSGGIIWFQAGTYKFTSAPNTIPNGCSIVGAGEDATIFNVVGLGGDFLKIGNGSVTPSSISKLKILNGGSWSSGYAISINGPWNKVQNVWIASAPNGIHITGASDSSVTDTLINDPANIGISCDNAVSDVFGATITRTTITWFGGGTSQTAIVAGAGCNTLRLQNVDTTPGGTCLSVLPGSSFVVTDDFECDHSQFGVQVSGGTGLQMQNDWFGSTIAGPGITFTSGFSGFATLTGEHIRDNSGYGVLINGSGGVQVNGSILSGNTTANISVGSNVSNFQINNNSIGVPGDATATFGILINSGSSDRYTIVGNNCGSNNTTGISDGGSGSHKSVTANAC